MKLQYEEVAQPTEVGLYACRAQDVHGRRIALDMFLARLENKWWVPWSEEEFKGEVYGWIGPLPRLNPLRTDVEAPGE